MIRKSVLLLAAAALSLPSLAHAQFGAYASFTADRLSNIQSAPGLPAGSYNDSVNPTGGTFGAYYDFYNLGPARLGVDARGTHITTDRGAAVNSVGAGTHIYSALGGVRASFKTPVKFLQPYAQISAGLGRSDFGFQQRTYSNAFEYHLYAGADFHLLPVVAWRVVELGYGGLSHNHNYPVASVSTGIVVTFGH